MFLYSLKSCVPRKYIGITNHNLATKNLIETRGIVLVKQVIKIHPRLKMIASVTGCFIIFLSNPRLLNSFNRNSTKTQASKGSVGRLRANPKSLSSRLIAKGVANTINHKTLSTEKIARKISTSAKGIKLNQ
jgi:hypothetical protein